MQRQAKELLEEQMPGFIKELLIIRLNRHLYNLGFCLKYLNLNIQPRIPNKWTILFH